MKLLVLFNVVKTEQLETDTETETPGLKTETPGCKTENETETQGLKTETLQRSRDNSRLTILIELLTSNFISTYFSDFCNMLLYSDFYCNWRTINDYVM